MNRCVDIWSGWVWLVVADSVACSRITNQRTNSQRKLSTQFLEECATPTKQVHQMQMIWPPSLLASSSGRRHTDRSKSSRAIVDLDASLPDCAMKCSQPETSDVVARSVVFDRAGGVSPQARRRRVPVRVSRINKTCCSWFWDRGSGPTVAA